MKKKIIIGLLAVLSGIQFFRIDKSQPTVVASENFVDIYQADSQVAGIMKKACYDCHSYEVTYPWYTNLAPLSWWIGHHIEEGRDHLNFSIWGTYKEKRQKHKLEECAEEVSEHKMPMESYTWMHGEARLSEEQITLLADYFENLYHQLP